jgi:hypothetical protein
MNKDEAFTLWASKHGMDDGHLPWETDRKVLLTVFTAGWDAHAESLKQAELFPVASPEGQDHGDVSAADIYAAYPRHEGRGAAIKAIEKAMKKLPPGVLMQATKDYAAAVKTWAPTVRYTTAGSDTVPMPTTWYNQERWTDDRAGWQRGGQKANPSQFSKTYQ